MTTEEGATRIRSDHGDIPKVVIRTTGEQGSTTPGAVLDLLKREFGVELLLHEGGPTVFGEFVAAKLIDELFLTLAPQIAGRSSGDRRLSIAGATRFSPENAPWLSLISIKRRRAICCCATHPTLDRVSTRRFPRESHHPTCTLPRQELARNPDPPSYRRVRAARQPRVGGGGNT